MDKTSNTKDNIIQTANILFAKCGVSAVKVDDICGQLTISKKTFYKYFQSKENLIMQVSEKILSSINGKMVDTVGNDKDIKEEASNIFDILTQFNSQYSTTFFNDINTHYPNIFKLFVKVKEDIIKNVMGKNIERGISRGIYNAELNVNFISNCWFEIIWLAYMEKYPTEQVKDHFINGLLRQSLIK
jgi:AcrR family transcriptional regulator